MRSAFAIAVVVLALVWPVASPAQSLDPASAEALAATLRLLQDPSARAAALGGNPQGSALDQQLQSLVGAANMQDIYALAAVIFNDLAQATGGDVGKLSQALTSGRNDPAGFAATLSPATLQRLRELSVKISDR